MNTDNLQPRAVSEFLGTDLSCVIYSTATLLQNIYEGVSKSFRTGRLSIELQMVQLSATSCSLIAILWVSVVSFAATTLCVASQRLLIVVKVYFVVDSVRKLLDWHSYSAGLVMHLIIRKRRNCFPDAFSAILNYNSLVLMPICYKYKSVVTKTITL
jgi:hypothetical protein